jgi:peptidoglycan/LPS O-acetylase OafA/YrhL
MTALPIPRRHDLDWLRIFAVLVVCFYHLARFFDPAWWHIKNAATYPSAGLSRLLVGAWMMPLIFLVSGAAAFYALKTRSPQAFVRDRAARLLIPFAAGVLTHVTLQVYLERRFSGQFAGSFLAFYPSYFDGVYGFGGNFAWMGLHLWFLGALFLYSVLLLPMFLWLRQGVGARALTRLTAFLARPGAVYLLALPVMALLATLNPATLAGNRDAGGWSLLIYPLFLVYGFILISHPPLEEGIRRARWISLGAALLLAFAVTLLWQRRGDPALPLDTALYGLDAWCWLLAIWGFGTLHLNRASPLLRYANDAVLPFYILHQSVMLATGYAVIRRPIPDALKFALIATLTFTVTLGIYHFLIRPFNLMRVLFGLRPRG